VDHNPNLKLLQAAQPNNIAGQGRIEVPGQTPNLVWQTRAVPPTAWENALADALQNAFEADALTLDAVVASLNAQGVRAADGQVWTAQSLEAVMADLGA
jgi:hypothetical protein